MGKNSFNGSRIKEAMAFRGKRLTELSEATGIAKQSLSNYIYDKNTPPYENVIKISNELGFPPQYFMSEDHCPTITDNTYFRSQAAATKSSRKAQSVKAEYIAKMHWVLSNYVDFPELDLPQKMDVHIDSSVETESTEVIDIIESLADHVRQEWKLGLGPIENLQYVMESHGIIVTSSRDVGSEIDAFSQRVRIKDDSNHSAVYIIALAIGEKPIERLRFDMAHELGHILMHSWEDSIEEIDKDAFNAREKQANMFASALLLPRKTFSLDVTPYATELGYYKQLKKKWGVSMQAMMYRARQLNIITGNQFSYMMRQVSKSGWRKHEPGDIPGKINSTIFQGAIDLLFDGGYLDSHELRIKFAEYGIILSDNDLTDLMGLKEGTIMPELEESFETKSSGKILQFTIRSSNSNKE